MHTTFHSFSHRAKEGDRSVILRKRLIFLLANWCNISFFPGGWEVTLAHWSVENNGERFRENRSAFLQKERTQEVWTTCFTHVQIRKNIKNVLMCYNNRGYNGILGSRKRWNIFVVV